MNKLFWGFFLIYFNFSLTANGSTLQILPAWLGYLMLYLACSELQGESELFQKPRPFCVGFAVYTGILWLLSLLNISANLGIVSWILGLLSVCLSLYVGKLIIDALANVEIRRNYDLCIAHLRNVWTLMAICSAASHLLVIVPALALGCATAAGFAVIFFLIALHGTRKAWQNMLYEQSKPF